ncbi:hypothetical protein D3C85_1377570 [compost metagenome]
MRIEHDVIAAVGQVEVIVQQTAIAERAGTGARQVAHAFHHHRDRPRGEQGLAQIVGIECDEARREVVQRVDRWRQAWVVDDQPLEVPRQPGATAQVVGDHR